MLSVVGRLGRATSSPRVGSAFRPPGDAPRLRWPEVGHAPQLHWRLSLDLGKTLRIWDTQTGIETLIQQFPGFLDSVTLTPDERRLLIGNIQGKVTILETGPP